MIIEDAENLNCLHAWHIIIVCMDQRVITNYEVYEIWFAHKQISKIIVCVVGAP